MTVVIASACCFSQQPEILGFRTDPQPVAAPARGRAPASREFVEGRLQAAISPLSEKENAEALRQRAIPKLSPDGLSCSGQGLCFVGRQKGQKSIGPAISGLVRTKPAAAVGHQPTGTSVSLHGIRLRES